MTSPHSTALYVPAGRGVLSIATWNGTTPPTYPSDYTDLGNCPSFEVEPKAEKRPHYSSRSGLRTRDLNPVVQLEYDISFDLDELAAVNMQKFFLGSLNTSTYVISALQSADTEYALRFVADNPLGPNQTYSFWRVTLSPSGPLQLIGDDYLVLSFSGEGLSDTVNHPSSPYFDIKYATTTTTSTSSSSTSTTN